MFGCLSSWGTSRNGLRDKDDNVGSVPPEAASHWERLSNVLYSFVGKLVALLARQTTQWITGDKLRYH